MNKVIGFKWTAVSDDDCFHDKSSKAFATQEDCYNDMMVHAVDKMKWNIEWGDVVERPVSPTENGLITEKQTGFGIGYTLDCYPDKIVHKSYSGEYTYQIHPIVVDEYADIHIIAQYNINGEIRAYTYCLGDLNDCNHYFDDEDKLTATYLLVDKGESEEDYYLQTPIEDVTRMVNAALEYLEEKARK